MIFYPFPFYVIIACFFSESLHFLPGNPPSELRTCKFFNRDSFFSTGAAQELSIHPIYEFKHVVFSVRIPNDRNIHQLLLFVFSHCCLTLESFFLVVEWGSCFPNVQETSETTGVCQPLGTKPGLSATTKIINTNCLFRF